MDVVPEWGWKLIKADGGQKEEEDEVGRLPVRGSFVVYVTRSYRVGSTATEDAPYR
jgi:hypothetical protein